MTDEELEEQIRSAFREIADATPEDTQPPASFWERVREEEFKTRPPYPPASTGLSNRARATVAVLTLAACAAVAFVAFRPWMNAQPTQTGGSVIHATLPSLHYVTQTPTPTTTGDRCVPGPTVHPTRSPQPAADSLKIAIQPGATDGDDHIAPADVQQVSSAAFTALTEVGGCVYAYLMLPDNTPPRNTRIIPDAPMGARSRVHHGLTEVYITTSDQTFVIVNGNLTDRDLANALAAALTRP